MIFLERDHDLHLLRQSLRQAAEGHGEMVFLGGEAGIGKSTLIETFLREAHAASRTVIVSCDGSAIPGPYGPLLDLSEALGIDTERWLADQAPRDVIFRAVLRAFREAPGPTVLVGEDAHWIDEATLELIRFLGRRIDGSRVLFIVVYRNDELGPYHPLRRVLGDLANAPSVRRIDLRPLTIDAVREMAMGTDIAPDELFARSGGNPFFVTEAIAAGTLELSTTVRDVVLARAARLSPEARSVLDAAAILATPIDDRLLEAVMGGPIDDLVEECLAVGMLRVTDDMLMFRHAITRDTILSSLSAPRRRALHQRVLDAMQENPALARNLAQFALHADEAGNDDATLRFATAAARDAAVFGAHSQAAGLYARALRAGSRLPASQRLPLLEAHAYECYLTGDIEQAIRIQEEAVALSHESDDPSRRGRNTRLLSRFCWFSGRTAEAARHANEARTLLEQLPPGPELAMAWSNLAQLSMLRRDVAQAVSWGERAIALATELDNPAILVHAMTNVGTARYASGDAAGRALIEEALRIAMEHGLEDDVARAYTNLGFTAWTLRQLPSAEQDLNEGIAYAAGRDLIAMELYQRAARASVLLARAEWDAARDESESICLLPQAIAGTRIVALVCLGRLHSLLREDPGDILDEARALAMQTDELQRLGPVSAARAEAAWLSEEMPDIDDLRENHRNAVALHDTWMAGELAIWLHRAGIGVDSSKLAEPFALEIDGDHEGAARAWDAIGCPVESARARASSGQEEDLRLALEAFERIGGRADALLVSRQLREMGARNIPRGPRPATRANASNLTARELDVLALMANGASNRQIAEELFLSPKTVGHHVSAILAKLNVASRGEATRYAQTQGLLQDREPEAAK